MMCLSRAVQTSAEPLFVSTNQKLILKYLECNYLCPHMLGDESMRGWHHVLLSPVEQEDDVVLEGVGGRGQHLQDLQHNCA